MRRLHRLLHASFLTRKRGFSVHFAGGGSPSCECAGRVNAVAAHESSTQHLSNVRHRALHARARQRESSAATVERITQKAARAAIGA
jgi:hypothetical protein